MSIMQDDHDLEHGPEEGEYHFSDEGVYETHTEETHASGLSEKTGLGAHFTSYRRFIIIGAIFAGILLVVYLLITPPTTPTPTQIVAAPPVARPAPMQAEVVTKAPVAAKNKVIAVVTTSPLVAKSSVVLDKAATPSIIEKNKVEPKPMITTVPTSTEVANVDTSKLTAPLQIAAQVPSAPPVQQVMAPLTNMAEMSHAANLPAALPMVVASAQQQFVDKGVIDRLTALEEENNKMINQLNTEYAHRLAEFETQDKALQEQIRALTTKISSMEAQMEQWQQNLNKQSSVPANNDHANRVNVNDNNSSNAVMFTLPGSEATTTTLNKASYAVQAIIPGRAWLRMDNGETVTVAEGDLLKGLGRVTKIDPYDGTIQIDTGTKMILLSYGNGDYS